MPGTIIKEDWVRQEKELTEKKNEEVKHEITSRDEVIQDLRKQVESFEEVVADNDKNSEILSRLFESKVTDARGELIGNYQSQESME